MASDEYLIKAVHNTGHRWGAVFSALRSEKVFSKPPFIDELHGLHAGPLKAPPNYLTIIAKGDEVLDWREMTRRYAGTRIRLLEGSDHALSDFDEHLPAILDFLDLDA